MQAGRLERDAQTPSGCQHVRFKSSRLGTASDNVFMNLTPQVAQNKPQSADAMAGKSLLCLQLETAPARFRSKVRIDDVTGCWVWTAGVRRTRYKSTVYAYAVYSVDGTTKGIDFAHRYAYEFFVGQIPEHLEIDHLCHNKLCVNPAHLEAVTHQQNCARRKKSGPYRTPGSVRDRRARQLFIPTGGADDTAALL